MRTFTIEVDYKGEKTNVVQELSIMDALTEVQRLIGRTIQVKRDKKTILGGASLGYATGAIDSSETKTYWIKEDA